MKIILIVLLSVINICWAQNGTRSIPPEKFLTKSVQLSQEQQCLKIIQFIIQYYGRSFKYYDELEKGNFKFEKLNNGKETSSYLFINPDVSAQNNSEKIVPFKLKLISVDCGTGSPELFFEVREIEKYIDFPKFKIRGIHTSIPIQIVDRSKVLFDQMILRNPDIPSEYWWILNKTFINENFENQYGEPASLFQLCQEGVLIPYGNGNHSKLLTIDNQGHGVVYFDSDIDPDSDEPINQVYGEYGFGHGQFMNPMGICLGRSEEYQNIMYYPVYVADQYNFRIVKVIYEFPVNSNQIGFFDDNSFATIDGISYPYDVGFARGRYLEGNPNPDNSDKVWVSEAHPFRPFLSCYSEYGILMQKFKGYIDNNTGTLYDFLPGSAIRLSVFYGDFRAISFVDNVRKCIVSCGLKGDGTADYVENIEGSYILASDILFFPDNENINSIKFQKTSSVNSLYPYIWVASDRKIHCLKMRAFMQNNIYYPQTQYLASTDRPYNSYLSFSNLMNIVATDGFNDLATIEAWNYQYGIRRYLPFADIYNDTLFDYCDDSTDQMSLKGVFTNDCWLQFTAERRKNNGSWESVKIKKINGEDINDYQATIYRLAGSTELWDNEILIQLDLPISDYLLGGRVKLHLKITPDNNNPYATENDYVYRDYEVNVSRNCIPKPGGCPFLYVKDENNNYVVDNNILHRSEFPEYQGQDIKDAYKLLVTPGVNENKMTIVIAENENDYNYFDQVKLYAVDHIAGTVMGITESNDIVVYNPSTVISTDSTVLNTTDITNLIQYQNPLGVNIHTSDNSYSHFPLNNKMALNKILKSKILKDNSKPLNNKGKSKNNISPRMDVLNDSVALIALTGSIDTTIPSTQKNWAGTINGYSYSGGMVTKNFARRERLSEVIIPLFGWIQSVGEFIEHADINWTCDQTLKYLSVVPISYENIVPVEIPLIEATHSSQGDILTQLQNIDGSYGTMDASAIITTKFDVTNLNPPSQGYIREYVIEVNGRYFRGSDNVSNKLQQQIALTYRLSQNYPNPFNPVTKINYEIPKTLKVNLVIYDILGREVKKLVNEIKEAGRYTVDFDMTNYASGVYFYRIEAGSFVMSKKMVLVK